MRNRMMLLALVAILGLAAAAPAEMYNAQYLAPFAEPAAMNQDGTVVGWNPVYGTPFVYDDQRGYSALPCPKIYASCDAVDVNDAGWIVGWAQSPGILQLRTAALWTPTHALAPYRFSTLSPSGLFNNSEAVAIDNFNRIVGLRSFARIGVAGERESFLWTAEGGMTRLAVPGPVSDLNDAGWVSGNASRPYMYQLAGGKLVWTRLSVGLVSATSHGIGADGSLIGGVVNDIGLSVAAKTDADGVWMPLGGGGGEDHLFGINKHGDVAGHVHGLDPESHCGVQFADEGEMKTLESLLHPRAQTWTMGEAFTGPTDERWLAGQAVNAKSGLPALVRLVPGKAEECGGNCLWVVSLEIRARANTALPSGWTAVARLGAAADIGTPVIVDATWIHDGGARVERRQYTAGPGGNVYLTTRTDSRTVQLYVTAVTAAGYRFDPTRGDLHAEQ